MEKLDLKKAYKSYFSAKQTPELFYFEPIWYLMLQGKGEPGGNEFQRATQALFPLAYTIKKTCKTDGKDFRVAPLEALWWTEGSLPASKVPKQNWHWKLMVRMPDFVDELLFKTALAETLKKKKIPLLNAVSFEQLCEGKCAQILHVGAYSEEQPTIDLLHGFIHKNNLSLNGFHHEIYLNNPRKTPVEKLKTIIRQPLK